MGTIPVASSIRPRHGIDLLVVMLVTLRMLAPMMLTPRISRIQWAIALLTLAGKFFTLIAFMPGQTGTAAHRVTASGDAKYQAQCQQILPIHRKSRPGSVADPCPPLEQPSAQNMWVRISSIGGWFW